MNKEIKIHIHIFLFLIFFLGMHNHKTNLCIKCHLPNIVSMFIFGPIMIINGMGIPKNKSMYSISLGFLSIALFFNIFYQLLIQKKKITIIKILYLFIFSPIMFYVSIKANHSNKLIKNILFLIAIIYTFYNTNKVTNISRVNITNFTKQLPEHPIRLLLNYFNIKHQNNCNKN